MSNISDKERQRRFLRKEGFSVEPPIDSMTLKNHPPHRRNQLDVVDRFYDVNLKQYIESGANSAPHRQAILQRAIYISALAFERTKSKDPSYSWQATLEQEILRPFRIESACETCGGVPELQLGLLHEEARQQLCTCDNYLQRQCMINLLFQEEIYQPTHQLLGTQELIVDGECSEYIYGLRPTESLRNAYDLQEELTVTRFEEDPKSMVFPFLVLGAQTPQSIDSLGDITFQSSLAIMEVLRIQLKLFEKAGRADPTQHQGPFAWHIAYRHDILTIRTAFAERVNNKVEYKVYSIWRGGITSRDKALQLTLVIDCIVDWARTQYRTNVLDSLHIIKTPQHERMRQSDGSVNKKRRRRSDHVERSRGLR